MKKLLALLLVCALVFSLSGCDKLDYHKAIALYNRRKYDAAAEAFAQLEGYADSGNMITLSNYWAAIDLMEAGKFTEALPRFIKLGDYEDSALRVTECRYRIAVTEFEAGNFHEAKNHFADVAGYKQTDEYLRRIQLQTLYEAIGTHPLGAEQNGKFFSLYADTENQALVLSVEHTEPEAQQYSDFLTITLTRDRTMADFICGSDFKMEYVTGTIGSSQSGYGRLDILTCTAHTPLGLETFEKTVWDNLGNTSTSQDPADSLMNDITAANLRDLLTVIPQLLLEAGMEATLQDIGFYALN
jgi:tetratricopeptide (TPR) repeat protein